MVVDVRSTVSEVYASTPESVAHIRRWATDFAAEMGADPETVDAVRLSVSEAVTNVVMHAYPDRPGKVQITLAVAGDEFWVLVADEGRGHQHAPESPGLGWGLALIAEAADEFVITERSGGGTELRIGFRLNANAGEPMSEPGNAQRV